MSVLRPRDGDYITRGISLLLGWFIIGFPTFAFVGALLAGAGGAAIGLVASVPLGVYLYSVYLKQDPALYPRRR